MNAGAAGVKGWRLPHPTPVCWVIAAVPTQKISPGLALLPETFSYSVARCFPAGAG